MRNMRMMRIMRICGICGCVCGLKISSTLYTYEYLPKMATFWARNGSAWLCFQFWVPKISLLFIPPGFIHPQEWKLRVQNHKILVKKRWFFFTIDAVYAHWCASDAHRCASAKIGAWPTLILSHNSKVFTAKKGGPGIMWFSIFGADRSEEVDSYAQPVNRTWLSIQNQGHILCHTLTLRTRLSWLTHIFNLKYVILVSVSSSLDKETINHYASPIHIQV